MPSRQRSHGFIAVMSRSPNRMRPALGGNTPAIMLNSVVLPAPFGPRMPTISPCSTLKSKVVDDDQPAEGARKRSEFKHRRRLSRAPPRHRQGVRASAPACRRPGCSAPAVVHDDQFERPFLALAPLPGDERRLAGVGKRPGLEVDRPDDRLVTHVAHASRIEAGSSSFCAASVRRSATSMSEWRKPRPIDACWLASFS